MSTLLKDYWNRFTKEYLLLLREYHRCTQEGGKLRKPETGEVVRRTHRDSVGNLEELQKDV